MLLFETSQKTIPYSFQLTKTQVEITVSTMAAKLEKEKLDLSVFETIGTECFGNDGDVDVNGCDHIVRLVIALQYYEVLQRTDDMERKKFFIDFLMQFIRNPK